LRGVVIRCVNNEASDMLRCALPDRVNG
jgi:hypothetical protein